MSRYPLLSVRMDAQRNTMNPAVIAGLEVRKTAMDYDVIVIGGGSAGYAAARTAHERGAKVAIIDQGPLSYTVMLSCTHKSRLISIYAPLIVQW